MGCFWIIFWDNFKNSLDHFSFRLEFFFRWASKGVEMNPNFNFLLRIDFDHLRFYFKKSINSWKSSKSFQSGESCVNVFPVILIDFEQPLNINIYSLFSHPVGFTQDDSLEMENPSNMGIVVLDPSLKKVLFLRMRNQKIFLRLNF